MKPQPVPDLSPHSTPREHEHDRDQARQDRRSDHHDRDTGRHIESYLRTLDAVSDSERAKPADTAAVFLPSTDGRAPVSPGRRRAPADHHERETA